MYKRIKYFIVFVFSLIILLNLNCTAVSSIEEGKTAEIAPDFTLQDIKGEDITLSQFKNKKNVLLVFGATWCPYCREEIPELKEIYKRYNDEDVKLLYVDIQESNQKVSSFVKEYAIPYTVLLDANGYVAKSYGVQGIPHQVIIDKEGRIYYEGPKPSKGLMALLLKLTQEY